MKSLIVCALLVAVVSAGKARITTLKDLPGPVNSRIISGKVAEEAQFPWQVANTFQVSGGWSFCGGALICDSWVLTAAHCAQGALRFQLQLGSVNQSQAVEDGRVTLESTEAIVHEGYDPYYLYNDIALIKLPTRVTYTDKIQPIRLAKVRAGAGWPLTVSGWGKTSDASNSVSPVLNFVDLTTIENQECYDNYGTVVIDSTLCCRGNPQHSTCNGDSGGPLVGIEEGRIVHVGVVSFVYAYGCSIGYPSGFGRTESHRDWILSKIGDTCVLP